MWEEFVERHGVEAVQRLMQVFEWGYDVQGMDTWNTPWGSSNYGVDGNTIYWDIAITNGIPFLDDPPHDLSDQADWLWAALQSNELKQLPDMGCTNGASTPTARDPKTSQAVALPQAGRLIDKLFLQVRNDLIIELATAGSGKALTLAIDLAHLARIRRLNGVTMAGGQYLVHSADAVRRYGPRVKSVAGFTDLFIHAEPNAFWVLHNGQWVSMTHRSLATFLKYKGVTGNVRLVSCNAGTGRLAQDLANKLGVTVRAADDTLTVLPDGRIVAPPGTSWKDFIPGVRP